MLSKISARRHLIPLCKLFVFLFSFSDWKLRVVIQRNPENKNANINDSSFKCTEKIYHVHRNVLAIGERRSGYFANLLHYGIDDGNNCSHVELSQRAAEHFPDLLDFMYSSRAFLVTTRNSIPLLFLSQAFQVVTLEGLVQRFIDNDIKLMNFGYYMSDALYFSDETIALKVIDTCEKEAMSLFSHENPTIQFGVSKIFEVPFLLSSVARGEKKVRTFWSFLSQNRIPFQSTYFSVNSSGAV